jgi:predicted ATP-grasp superfamily ATP-dependent carboligase
MAVARDYASSVSTTWTSSPTRRGVSGGGEPALVASVELVERAHGFSMFGLHADACSRGTLPDDRHAALSAARLGKAIVFARQRSVRARSMMALSRRRGRRAAPRTIISPGQPICTVFASAHRSECHAGLVAAPAIYAECDRGR